VGGLHAMRGGLEHVVGGRIQSLMFCIEVLVSANGPR